MADRQEWYRLPETLPWVQDTFPNGKHISMVSRWRTDWCGRDIVITCERNPVTPEWTCHFVGEPHQRIKGCTSDDAAKAYAEEAVRSRLRSCLTPVDDKEVFVYAMNLPIETVKDVPVKEVTGT